MSFGDWIALGIIAAAVICAVIYLVKNRRGGCNGCPYAGNCINNTNDCPGRKNDAGRK